MFRFCNYNRDRETAQEKLEFECEGIDCAWCGIVDCPREKKSLDEIEKQV